VKELEESGSSTSAKVGSTSREPLGERSRREGLTWQLLPMWHSVGPDRDSTLAILPYHLPPTHKFFWRAALEAKRVNAELTWKGEIGHH